jgi:hypothetical protein
MPPGGTVSRWSRSRTSGVNAETIPITPTAAAAHARSDLALDAASCGQVAPHRRIGLYIQDAFSHTERARSGATAPVTPLLTLTAAGLLV